MELLRAGNVFEASKICEIFGKVVHFIFITIKRDKKGNYYAYTSLFDIVRIAIGIIYCCFVFIDVSKPYEQYSSRSTIFELMVWINTRIEVLHPTFALIIVFYFRYDYFTIKKTLQKIDDKVNFAN